MTSSSEARPARSLKEFFDAMVTTPFKWSIT